MAVGVACEAVFTGVAVALAGEAAVGAACGFAVADTCGWGVVGAACGCCVAAGCVNMGFMACLGLRPLATSSPSAVI